MPAREILFSLEDVPGASSQNKEATAGIPVGVRQALKNTALSIIHSPTLIPYQKWKCRGAEGAWKNRIMSGCWRIEREGAMEGWVRDEQELMLAGARAGKPAGGSCRKAGTVIQRRDWKRETVTGGRDCLRLAIGWAAVSSECGKQWDMAERSKQRREMVSVWLCAAGKVSKVSRDK